MSRWNIQIPHRDPGDSLVEVAGLARHLDGDDRLVARAIALGARLDGLATAGELIDRIGALEPQERRKMLDHARAEVGLPSTAEVDAAQRATQPLIVRTTGAGGSFPSCADPECNAVPMRLGGFYNPAVRRWWCPNHVDQAEPGDLEPRGSGIKLSPSGVPIPDDPAADAADLDREASRRTQLEAEAEIRAIEAAEHRRSREARDEAHQRELPEHLRPRPQQAAP